MDIQANNEFIPAHPKPHSAPQTITKTLLGARKNVLSIWWEDAYVKPIITGRILKRQFVIANSPETVSHVMVKNNDNYERKSPQMRRALEFLLGDGLFISDGDTWRARRDVVTPIVHRRELGSFAPIMVDTAQEMADRWAGVAPDRAVDILTEMAHLTAEIISRAVFGRDLGHAHAMDVVSGFSRYQRHIDQVNMPYFFGADEGWPTVKWPWIRQATSKVHAVIHNVIDAHSRGRGDDSSMIAKLLDAKDKRTGCPFSKEAITNEAATIFMAGHETTANTLAWVWYLLGNAPWAEETLHQELDEVVGNRPPVLADVPKLKYTRAVIEEAMRLYPPVPILARQTRDKDTILDRRIWPGGLVMVVPWLLHRHRLYWDKPDHFIPERFMDGAPKQFTYVPFAIGPRICAGASFGLTEAILCVAVLAKRFRLRVRDDFVVEPHCRLTVRPRGGMPMTITPRG